MVPGARSIVPMPHFSPTRQAIAVWPLFVAVAFLMLGNALGASVLGLRADREGFSTATLGLVMAGYYVGFLLGSVLVPAAVSRVGHIRVYAGLASLASVATLGHLLLIHPVSWFGLRVLSGACLAGLYIVAESWLNGASNDRTRGRLLAIYMVVVTTGIAGGQMLLNAGDPGGFVLFLLASIFVSLALVPVALIDLPAPAIPGMGPVPYRYILGRAPIGLLGALVTGAANGAFFAMGAVWGATAGLPVSRIALLLTLALLGGAALQLPLGAISDRVSRRRVIFAATSLAAGLAVAMSDLDPGSTAAALVVFALGGFSFPMYSLSASHVNDLVGKDLAVGTSSAIMFANGTGSIIGPVVAGLAMATYGPPGLWYTIAAAHGILALYAAWRLLRRWDIPAPFKGRYLPLPARSGGLRPVLGDQTPLGRK